MSSAPEIRYCTTTDGVNIAYWTMGSGPALLHGPPVGPFSDIAMELDLDDARAWYERLARTHTLIRYDLRGCGSSGRGGSGPSIDGFTRDVEAVARALPFGSYDVFASGSGSPTGITLAATRPELVSHLILWGGFARPSDYTPPDRLIATRALIEKNWAGYTDAWAQTMFGWSRASQARAWSRLFRNATNQDDTLQRIEAILSADTSELLRSIAAPVLVVDIRGRESGRYLAANLTDARLVVRDRAWATPATDPERLEENARLIDEFIGVTVPEQSAQEAPPSTGSQASGTAVILFTDIVDSTALTERLGDARFRELSRALDAGLRAAIRDAGGSAIEGKLLGDGVLATFPSAAQAIDGARRCLALSAASELGLHIGLHAGDVIREEVDGRRDVFGGAVNIASRICGLSAPGEILVSDVVRGMARSSAGVVFEDRGEQEMKGVGEPVRVYAVMGVGA